MTCERFSVRSVRYSWLMVECICIEAIQGEGRRKIMWGKCCQDWSFLLCFVVTFCHILHFLIKMIFCCWFGHKNDLLFPPLKWLTLSVINMSVIPAWCGQLSMECMYIKAIYGYESVVGERKWSSWLFVFGHFGHFWALFGHFLVLWNC